MALVSKNPFQLTGRYAERNKWEVINGPGDSRPTGQQIIEDEGLIGAMSDKVVFITGVSSGMGPETVRALASTGATIFATARNLDKAREALGPALLETGRVHLLFMDQTDLSSVRACVDEFRQRCGGKLNILINNAGVMKTPEGRTKDGFELQFGTNHLSHFLLFYLLKDLLLASSTPEFHSRVVNVSSVGHRHGPVRFDNLNFEGEYDGWAAYGQSKTANIYMATQIERLYGAQGLHGFSLSPGSFASPNLQKFCQDEQAAAEIDERMSRYFTNVQQGCATSVYAAVSKDLEGKGGLYLEGASVAGQVTGDYDRVEYGYNEWAFDREKEEKLWEVSKKLVGVE
ncbi:short-chain dehydrogenase [Annulohypoxylon truncatum]|uniref:short-chain dehydrogenase n=1 Tax=Annulohypoxylon truncatum TaxID=327061 RepID=UPI00200826C0|nr:short-chain dehydrogenase [Annulohypoxylon truncatum]KAI1211764.1 short-chain dehydrogenase [Annulohypoxylon truncatum]